MGKRAQRRREQRKIIENLSDIVEPLIRAEELRRKGVDIEAHVVNLRPGVEGFILICEGCGRTATLPFDPGTRAALCPDCARKGGLMQ